MSLRLLGTLLKWLWLPLLPSLGIALYDGTATTPFFVPMLATAAVGFGLEQLTEERTLWAQEAFLMVSLTWLSIALVGDGPPVRGERADHRALPVAVVDGSVAPTNARTGGSPTFGGKHSGSRLSS